MERESAIDALMHMLRSAESRYNQWAPDNDNDCACVEPGTTPAATRPIDRFNVRSFITSVADGARLTAAQQALVRGIAFDGGQGIREVASSQ